MSSLHLLGYIDPGSGTIFLQLVVAGAIGFVVYCRDSFLRNLRQLVKRGRTSVPASEETSVEPERHERRAA